MNTPARVKTRHAVARIAELPPGARKIVTIPSPASGQEMQLGVFNVGGRLVAYRNVCPHGGAPVCEGRVCGTTAHARVGKYVLVREGEILRCPWHGWEFDLLNGQRLADEAIRMHACDVEASPPANGSPDDLAAFEVETSEDTVWVLI